MYFVDQIVFFSFLNGDVRRATERMTTYKPAEHQETTSVAPLVQFFELVHIGDMIPSMVQVYFDKELVSGVFQLFVNLWF